MNDDAPLNRLPVASAFEPGEPAHLPVGVEVAGGDQHFLALGAVHEGFSGAAGVVWAGVHEGAPVGFVDLDRVVYQVADDSCLLTLQS